MEIRNWVGLVLAVIVAGLLAYGVYLVYGSLIH